MQLLTHVLAGWVGGNTFGRTGGMPVNLLESPWTAVLALGLALLVGWLLERTFRSRALHWIIAACSIAATFLINRYLHPWDSPSPWLQGLGSFLVFMAAIEISQAVLFETKRNAT